MNIGLDCSLSFKKEANGSSCHSGPEHRWRYEWRTARFCCCPPKALRRAESYAHTNWTKIPDSSSRALFTSCERSSLQHPKAQPHATPAARAPTHLGHICGRHNPAKARVAGLLEEVMHTCTGDLRASRLPCCAQLNMKIKSHEGPLMFLRSNHAMVYICTCMHACNHHSMKHDMRS